MKKIEFFIHQKAGKRCAATKDEYILLFYYLSDRNDIETIERVIRELSIVQNEEKTFKEVFEDIYGTITINISAGEFECDKDTAYFISNNPDSEPHFEMPLKELIDILKDWKKFLEKK